MKDFVARIVEAILENKNFEVTEDDQGDLYTITIFVPEENIGHLIGKEGKIINSIRSLCRMKAKNTIPNLIIKVDKLSV